jgi:hypothetical protein
MWAHAIDMHDRVAISRRMESSCLLHLARTCVQEEGRRQRTDRSIDPDVARQCRNAMRRPDALGLRCTHGIDPTRRRCRFGAISGLLAAARSPVGRRSSLPCPAAHARLRSGLLSASARLYHIQQLMSRNSGASPLCHEWEACSRSAP